MRVRSAIRAWDKFWFAPRDLYSVSLFRCLLGFLLFVMYSMRFADWDYYYGEHGIVPVELALDLFPGALRPPIEVFFHSAAAAWWLHLAYLVLLFLLGLGLIGRSLTWLVLLVHISFLQRNYSIVYGADIFATYWLLGLSFVKHNHFFNIRHLWGRGAADERAEFTLSDYVSSLGMRLIQVQLSIAYAYTGLEKLKGNQWWDGTAIWYVIGDVQIVGVNLSFFRDLPLLVGTLTFLTLVFEIYFPAMAWNRITRPYWLLLGLGMHLFIAVFMGLYFFALVMILSYLLWVDGDVIRGFMQRVWRAPKHDLDHRTSS